MMIEEYIEVSGIPQGKYSLSKIKFDKTMYIYLVSEMGEILLSFGEYPVYFRIEEEECDFSRINDLSKTLGKKMKDYTVFGVKNSILIEKIIQESYDWYNRELLHHYLLLTVDNIIDIVTPNTISISIKKNVF